MMTDKQATVRIHNWLLFRVSGISAALSGKDYEGESLAVQEQVGKVDVEVRKLQKLLRGEHV